MSDITLQKLDGRHALSTMFTHRVKIVGTDNVPKWIEIRNWLWENYGPGLERETIWVTQYHDQVVPKWSWHIDDRKYFLYLKEETLTHFSLKYLNT